MLSRPAGRLFAAMLCASWFYMCKFMGGPAYLAARLTSMTAYTLLFIGGPISAVGFHFVSWQRLFLCRAPFDHRVHP